jgi:hypothetical protein
VEVNKIAINHSCHNSSSRNREERREKRAVQVVGVPLEERIVQ